MQNEMLTTAADAFTSIMGYVVPAVTKGVTTFRRWVGDYRQTTEGFSDLNRDIKWLTDIEAMLILTCEIDVELGYLDSYTAIPAGKKKTPLADLTERINTLSQTAAEYFADEETKTTTVESAQKQLEELYTVRSYLQEARKTKQAARQLLQKITTRENPLSPHEQQARDLFAAKLETLWTTYDTIKNAIEPLLAPLNATCQTLELSNPQSTWTTQWNDLPIPKEIYDLYQKPYPTVDESKRLFIALNGITYYLRDDQKICMQKGIPTEKKVLLEKTATLAKKLYANRLEKLCLSHYLVTKPVQYIVEVMTPFYKGKAREDGDTSNYTIWAVALASWRSGTRSIQLINTLTKYNQNSRNISFTLELSSARQKLEIGE